MTRPALGWLASSRARHVELRWLLALSALAALLFNRWPQLDLATAEYFYAGQGNFPWRENVVVDAVYVAVPWLGRLALLLCVWVLWRYWRQPASVGRGRMRRALALALALVLGVGLVVHGVFKEHWGRPRPNAVQQFGGVKQFQPLLVPSAQCARNCSFVSGHAATGFVLLAVGLMAAPQRRRFWLGLGWAAGLAVGWVRIVQGGHFLSDVLFAGFILWAVCLGLRSAWLVLSARQRARRNPQRLPATPPSAR